MHRSLTFLIVLSLALTVGCASGTSGARPESIAKPTIEPRLASPIFFGSSNTAPVTIDMIITNNASVPVMVRRIDVESPGMAMYTLARTSRDFRETLQPGETKNLAIFATATTMTPRPSEPLTIRAVIEMESGGALWREIIMTR